jgi:hypothetical protein
LFDVSKVKTRRKIRLIEGNAKYRHLKTYLSKDFAAGVYLSEATPLTHCREGGGGRVEPERRVRDNRSKIPT